MDVTPKYIRGWLAELRLSNRMPNRTLKVRRFVLEERLAIWWINTAVIRRWVQLEFGYDPHFRNVDHTPFHRNAAGSKTCKAISAGVSMRVPLIEGHAATRERMSVSTVTDSNEHRIRRGELPGFEVMFKAEGRRKEAQLQQHAAALGCPFKLSVVTGQSGSYKEEDLLAMQDQWLKPWGPNRRWEGWLGDAYSPMLTGNITQQCWRKGYQSFTHGGGASPITQTNDTSVHKPARADFCDLQQQCVMGKTLNSGAA